MATGSRGKLEMLDTSGWGAYLAWGVLAIVLWIGLIIFELLPKICSRKVRVTERLHFFDRVLTPVATFDAGHRMLY